MRRALHRCRDCWARMPSHDRLWIGLCTSTTFGLAVEQFTLRGHL